MESQVWNEQADRFIQNDARWRAPLMSLRMLALESGLDETFKWGKPCYTLDGANVAILFSFQDSCAIGFLKGSLLEDEAGALRSPGEHSQAMRMLHFTSEAEVHARAAEVRAFLKKAIAAERAGLKVTFTESAAPELPEELTALFSKNPALKTAFSALTPGRQRAYALYFSGAKQAKTRVARIEKHLPRILSGKGLNDPD